MRSEFLTGVRITALPLLVAALPLQPASAQAVAPPMVYRLHPPVFSVACDRLPETPFRVPPPARVGPGGRCASELQTLSSVRRSRPNGWVLVGSLTLIFGVAFAVMLPEAARRAPYLFIGRCDSCEVPSRLESAVIGAGFGAAVGFTICLSAGCDWGAPRAPGRITRGPRLEVMAGPRSVGLSIHR